MKCFEGISYYPQFSISTSSTAGEKSKVKRISETTACLVQRHLVDKARLKHLLPSFVQHSIIHPQIYGFIKFDTSTFRDLFSNSMQWLGIFSYRFLVLLKRNKTTAEGKEGKKRQRKTPKLVGCKKKLITFISYIFAFSTQKQHQNKKESRNKNDNSHSLSLSLLSFFSFRLLLHMRYTSKIYNLIEYNHDNDIAQKINISCF